MEDKFFEKVLELLCEAAGCTTPLQLIGKPAEVRIDHGNSKYTAHITSIEKIFQSNRSDIWYEKFQLLFNGFTYLDKSTRVIVPKFSAEKPPETLDDIDWRFCKLFPTPNLVLKLHSQCSCMFTISSLN